jgi:CubicO group peptidase (beta-lactamase class C family)
MNTRPTNLASRFALLLLGTPAAVTGLDAQSTRLDSLDAFVRAQMAERRIPGVSLAIIQDGKIAVARAYGVVDQSSNAPVTTATLFQAGSISKPVSALGALHLVEAGKLSLDGDVNARLTSWKVPESRFTATEKVTLRRLLSHSAGLTVHGFPGYDAEVPVPTVVQVLDGAAPANTRPIRVDTPPGAIWRYSGGGYTVMQQMMIDVTGTPFPRYMKESVLGPIGMMSSSFEQPLPPAHATLTASGYYSNRTAVRGRWHLYPEMAAAGLWTTPTDLARFAIEVQESYAGRGHGVISPAMARQYLTEQKGGSGLGIAVGGSGRSLRFGHGGRDEGFDASLNAFAETGQGLVVMINANDNSRFMARLESFVARTWGWPARPENQAPAGSAVAMTPGLLARFAGYYEAAENNMVTLVPSSRGTGLQTLADGLPDEDLLPIDSITFGSTERAMKLRFFLDGPGIVAGVVLRPGEPRERRAPRVAPLPSTRSDSPDPDERLTVRIKAALAAMERGGTVLAEAPDVTPGAKKDFERGAGGALEGLGPLNYLGQEEVTGRGIRRHGGEVARVRYYRVTTSAGQRFLLVHLTADGTITDFDVVER